MRLPAARSSTKAAAATAFLSPTTASTILVQPLALAASGLRGISHTAANALHTTAMMLIYRQKYSPEPEVLAPGTAVFKPRIVRFAVPVVYCHAKGLLPGTACDTECECVCCTHIVACTYYYYYEEAVFCFVFAFMRSRSRRWCYFPRQARRTCVYVRSVY